jgi:hypothetical protein
VQLVQALEPDDRPRRAAFATEMLQRIGEDNDYLTRVCFPHEATFHTSEKADRQSPHWGVREPTCCFREREEQP